MAAKNLINRLRDGLQALRTAQGGNVVITFALATLPIVGFVGAAVDYSRANSAKASMQAAVDSAALMLSKDAQTLTTAQLNQKALAYFNSLFNRTDVTNVLITPTYSIPQQGSFRLDVTGTGKVATTFTKVFGQQEMDVNVTSQVQWGMRKLELALALDNTLSMLASGKMTALKVAAKNLLTTLKNAEKTPGDIKVSIVPFNTVVKLNKTYPSPSWFDWTQITQVLWQGCVADRNQPYDVQDTAPTSSLTNFPATPCDTGFFSSGVLAPIVPLTSDWTKLNTAVDSMVPDGTTNITIGLVWAWHSLTTGAPMSEGAAPAADLDKVIILMTDGENTQNRWTTFLSGPIDARTALACANIKAANIKLYTIRVLEGNATLLQNCASNPSMYFDVQQASQLDGVFAAIAKNLANLRIAK